MEMVVIDAFKQMLVSVGIPSERAPDVLKGIQAIYLDQSLTKQHRDGKVAIFLANYGQENPVRTYLHVPYEDKERAKALGARWDPLKKRWFAPDEKIKAKCIEWL